MVAAREIVSPHDGVIVEIYKRVGEAITVGMPIYKVVAIDRMRVTGYLDAGDAWRVRQGQAARIVPELEGGDLPIEREVFEGKITFVDSEIDPKTRTCRVFAEVENRGDLLRSGLECRMEISPSAASGVVSPSARSGPGPVPDHGGPKGLGRSMRRSRSAPWRLLIRWGLQRSSTITALPFSSARPKRGIVRHHHRHPRGRPGNEIADRRLRSSQGSGERPRMPIPRLSS
jgi:Barrel-sandwich domain of CusB or HlyD membrane-fusion